MKLRTEIRKRVVKRLMDRISPEQYADMLVLGLQAGNEQTTLDFETGKPKRIVVPNWSAIQHSMETIQNIWGITASKQIEDVTDQNDDDQSIEHIREQRRIVECEIKKLRTGGIETVGKTEETVVAGEGEN